MTDAVRNVPEQELLSSRHARIPDYQHVDRFAFGGTDDSQRRIGIDDDKGASPFPGQLRHDVGKFLAGGFGLRLFGRAEFRDGRMLRHDNLHHKQLRSITICELSGPPDGMVRRFGTVGSHHHTSYGGGG